MKITDSNGQIRPNLSLFGLLLLALIVFISSAGLRYAYGSLEMLRDDRDTYIERHIRSDYETWSEIVRYARNLNRFFIHHRAFDGTASASVVTQDDMAEDMAFLTNMLTSQLIESLNRFISTIYYEDKSPSSAIEAQITLMEEIAALAPLYIDTLDSRWQVRLSERVSNFTAVQSYLEITQEFVYILHDGVLDQTFKNIDAPDIYIFLSEEVYAVIDLSDIFDTFNGIPLNEGFARGSISGLIALPIDQPQGSVVTQSVHRAHASWLNSIEDARGVTRVYIGLILGVALIMAIVILKSLLPNLAGSWSGVLALFNIYLKLPILFKAVFAFYGIAFIVRFTHALSTQPPRLSQLAPLYLAFIIMMLSIILLSRAFHGKYQFSDELEVRIVKKAISGFGVLRRLSPVLLPAILILIMIFSVIFLLLGLYFLYVTSIVSFAVSIFYASLAIVSLGISVAGCAVLLMFITYAESYYYIKIMAEGHPVIIPEQKGIWGKPLNMLSGLSHGLQTSLEEQLQAERTKTELITSVSHDLKTPLTSIINYVDLLKKSNIEDVPAREYVEILENKSERLKILIEDLFEAAKLTSGSMELNIDSVDIAQLLTQAIGELSDKFESKDIDIRYKPPADKIIIMLDGQRMWRVFENLLNNIANYSPPGSRAYISLEEQKSGVEIVMKNVSLYPLDIDANELFERFKRGDSARTTEGSGLGLSIAKDIVELHGGRVEIAIDGDLFKVIIGLNKAS